VGYFEHRASVAKFATAYEHWRDATNIVAFASDYHHWVAEVNAAGAAFRAAEAQQHKAKTAVAAYENWGENGFVQGCGNLAVIGGCVTFTNSGTYGSLGPGIGYPGATVNVGASRGESAGNQAKGWSACVDANFGVGAGHCWSNSSSATTNYGEAGIPGAGVFILYGWKF
jgi:hypothetical protein